MYDYSSNSSIHLVISFSVTELLNLLPSNQFILLLYFFKSLSLCDIPVEPEVQNGITVFPLKL